MGAVMRVQDTSREAHRDIEASGLAETQRAAVLAAMREHPDSTSGEICDLLRKGWHGGNFPQTRARFTELRDKGLAENTGKRACRVTGRTCMTWRVTERELDPAEAAQVLARQFGRLFL